MTTVVAAVIEREDRRLLIGQRRKNDTSPLKWEFPGGKVREGEDAEAALARELREELGVTLAKCLEIGRVRHQYAAAAEELEIRFFAAAIGEAKIVPTCFERVAKGAGAVRFSRSERRIGGESGDRKNQAGGVARTLLVFLKVARKRRIMFGLVGASLS
jgi:mutator protein MutT